LPGQQTSASDDTQPSLDTDLAMLLRFLSILYQGMLIHLLLSSLLSGPYRCDGLGPRAGDKGNREVRSWSID